MAEKEKKQNVRKPLHKIFTDIPNHYDLVNHLITWGLDKRWRKAAALKCLSKKPQRMLDLCCGTGDLALTVARLADYPIEIRGLDFSQPMLEIAAQKASSLKGKTIAFDQGDASKMPYENGHFDCVSNSFGFRNLTYNNPQSREHLSEILRVLKPGGRLVVVESSQPRSSFVRFFYHLYMRYYVYWVGVIVSGNKPAYRYLSESTIKYYSPPELEKLLTSAGFREVNYHPMLFGASGIYEAIK